MSTLRQGGDMQSYLVEVYVPRSGAHDARITARRARAAAARLTREGTPVTYVRTTFLPDDETCFHVFEAESSSAVDAVCARARLGRIRIVPAIEDPHTRHRPSR
jgi:hypothetical protein